MLAAAFNPSDATLVTVGVNHVTFWTFLKGKLSGVEGTWGDKGQPRTLESIEFVCRGSPLPPTHILKTPTPHSEVLLKPCDPESPQPLLP